MPAWLWGTLTPEHLAFAESFARRMSDTIAAKGLKQNRYSHTPDRWYQNLVGAEGEVAFRVLTGRPLPTIEEAAGTWKGADCDGYAVKTVSQPHYRLVFDESDLAPARALVLMLNQKPRFALVGWIGKETARLVRTWGDNLPRPAWVIEQHHLEPWDDEGI